MKVIIVGLKHGIRKSFKEVRGSLSDDAKFASWIGIF
jgi:hypothetical protein